MSLTFSTVGRRKWPGVTSLSQSPTVSGSLPGHGLGRATVTPEPRESRSPPLQAARSLLAGLRWGWGVTLRLLGEEPSMLSSIDEFE